MTVGLVGAGPAADAIKAGLADVDCTLTEPSPEDVDTVSFALVVGAPNDPVFEQVNERALAGGIPWLGVEIGSVGGHPLVEAAITGFSPDTGCYECLRRRVGSNLAKQTDNTPTPAAHTERLAGAIAAHAAARALKSDAPQVFGQIIEIPHSERRFQPVPNCRCGASPSTALQWDEGSRSTDEALARAERAVDEHVGIVQEVGEAESFPAPYYLARNCDTSGFSDGSASRQAAGVAADWDVAFMKALGEALERYSAGVFGRDSFQLASYQALDAALDPQSVVRPTDSLPSLDVAIPWVEGQRLDTREETSLPASLVHFPAPGSHFQPSLTSGLGLGNSTAEALCSGLYERIERDATMLAWYSTYEPLELTVDDETFQTLARRARSEDLTVTPLLVTQDVDVPVVAVAVTREEWPAFAIGSAAHLDPTEAATGALAEALQNWMELRGMGPDEAESADGAIGYYALFPEAAREFVDVEQSLPAANVGPETVPDGVAHVDALVERLSDVGLTAYGARVTPRDVEALGFEVVRTIVPQAQPLFLDDPFFGDRATTVPEGMGFEPRTDRDQHPFP